MRGASLVIDASRAAAGARHAAEAGAEARQESAVRLRPLRSAMRRLRWRPPPSPPVHTAPSPPLRTAAASRRGVRRVPSPADSPPRRAHPPRVSLFYTGTAIFAVGAILNFVSFSFAPTAVLAPLESIQ